MVQKEELVNAFVASRIGPRTKQVPKDCVYIYVACMNRAANKGVTRVEESVRPKLFR